MALDIAAVRVARHATLAKLFLDARHRQPLTATTKQILDAIRAESLPPTVFDIWLTVSHSDEAVALALRQDYSCLVRRHAIMQFGRKMERASWESIWNTLGGVGGIIALFAELSVVEVKQVCRLLGKRSRGLGLPLRELGMERLLRALVSFYHTTSDLKSTDKRPLHRYYARLVTGCPTPFVAELLGQADNPLRAHVDPARIVKYHPELTSKVVREFGFIWPLYSTLSYDLPSGKRDAANLSPAMHILSGLLAEIASGSITGLSPYQTMGCIAGPLLGRALENRLSDDKIMHIIRSTIKYLERDSLNIRWSRSQTSAFLRHLACYWSRTGATMHPSSDLALSECLRLYGVNERYENYDNAVEVALDLYPKVHRGHRFALLRHVLRSFTKPGINLDDLGSDGAPMFSTWSCKLFIDMDTSKARALFDILAQTRNDGDFLALESGDSIFSHPIKPKGLRVDAGLLSTYLSRGQEGSMLQAEKTMDKMQRQSTSSKDQADRAFYAKSAMFYAIASGSIELYHDVIIWSRRYIKDPMTVRVVFGRGSILTAQGIDLLSGMYNDKLHLSATPLDQWQIAKSNSVLFELFDICCYSLKEPSFNANDWTAVKEIFRLVVERRMSIMTLLQHNQHVSQETIVDKVWRDTIDMLVRVERTACKPESERLCFNSAAGPLGPGIPYSPGAGTIRFSSASYLFLDMLARARDELWRDIRSSYNPAAVCLSHPWPKGLPVQQLVPFDISNKAASGCTSFISARAVNIVFINEDDSQCAIPPDEETRSAIGGFVDSYQTALRIRILQIREDRARYDEVAQAWEHAIKVTRHRMNDREAVQFWRGHFQAALPSMKLNLPLDIMESQEYPLLPKPNGDFETQEWDPAYNRPGGIKSRSLPASLIDCLLSPSASTMNVFTCFSEPQVMTPSFQPSPIWNMSNDKERPASVEEGLIASALLYIDSVNNKRSRLLAKPFPSINVSRFPSLILDSDFLLDETLSSTQAMGVLRHEIVRTPSTLLTSLAAGILSSSLSTTTSENITQTSTVGCRLLALCTKMDQPQIACDLILKTIIEYPDTSAWHRQFLSQALLCRLSATNATYMLRNFGTAIEAKLDAQCSNEVKKDEAPKPALKVTTVKHLAQLLNQSSFISPHESLDILSSLFRKSNHRDIHYAIAESMLGMLAGTAVDDASALVDEALPALQALIPVVGRLTERIDLQKIDWIAFGQGGKIPVIEDQDATPPLFGLLLDYASKSTLSHLVRRRLVEQVILPAYELGRATYKRWVTVLLSRYGTSMDLEVLSSIRVRHVALAAMLRRIPEMLPETYVMEWHHYVIADLSPSPELSAAIHRLVDNVKSEDTSDPKLTPETDVLSHWKKLLDPSNKIFGKFSLASLLQRPQYYPSIGFGDDTISLVRKLVLEQADILITGFNALSHNWNEFIAPLRLDKYHANAKQRKEWQENCAPVINTIILRIESTRKGIDWRDDPTRKPRFLPLTFDLHLALLAAVDENDHAELAEDVYWLLHGVSEDYRPYHHELAQLKSEVLRRLGTAAQVEVACYLGVIDDVHDREPTLTDFLCVDLAHWLLRLANQKKDGSDAVRKAFEKSKMMLESWSKSRNEEFRMRSAVGFEKHASSSLFLPCFSYCCAYGLGSSFFIPWAGMIVRGYQCLSNG
ncbi:MAG: hypothetical protein Q9169_005828 [Polycauliona sp. 2 TL-2023]